MGTGYRIALGYNSNFGKTEATAEMFKIAKQIALEPKFLAQEVWKYDKSFNAGEIMDFCMAFAEQKDATIRFKEDDEEPHIFMLATGTGYTRLLKEATRRAFIRRMVDLMHRQGIEISVIVG